MSTPMKGDHCGWPEYYEPAEIRQADRDDADTAALAEWVDQQIPSAPQGATRSHE